MSGGRSTGLARTAMIFAAATLAVEVAGGAVALAVTGAAAPAVLAALGNACVALRFGITLLPGREPLISRYSRFDAAGLPDGHGGYTRRLTAVWTVLLGALALVYAGMGLAALPVGPILALQPFLCLGLFLGEHVLRNRLFPQHGRATPLRTLRAIRLAQGSAPHVA